MKPEPLNCEADLHTAIAHIEAGTPKFGLVLLSKYQNCPHTNDECRYNGDECAIPELLEGFFGRRSDQGND